MGVSLPDIQLSPLFAEIIDDRPKHLGALKIAYDTSAIDCLETLRLTYSWTDHRRPFHMMSLATSLPRKPTAD
jgi:hypothetical protein